MYKQHGSAVSVRNRPALVLGSTHFRSDFLEFGRSESLAATKKVTRYPRNVHRSVPIGPSVPVLSPSVRLCACRDCARV